MKKTWLYRLREQGKYVFDAVTREDLKNNFLQAIPFWVASLLTGLVAVGYSKLFNYSENLLQAILHGDSWIIFLITPACFLAAWYIIRFAPTARGSGIPQVMAAIDMSGARPEGRIRALLNVRVILVKISSSLLMVLGGGAIGREGPTIQLAGGIFRLVNRMTPRSWPQLGQKSFILTGAAAGLAAAFNTPLGGVVFAIEELAKIHISVFRTALFTAVIIAGLTAQGLLGPYLYLGYPDVRGLPLSTFAGVVVAAILAGLLGGLMGKIILKIMRWKKRFTRPETVLFIIVTGLGIAAVAYFANSHILGSGKELMNEVLFTDRKAVTWDTMLVRFAGIILSFNIGAAGGVFAPSLAAGASVGALLCHVFHVSGANANILILSGMVGFLTGVTRTPFTSAILVLEMTDRHSVIFHLMVAAMVSNIVALIVDKQSLYGQLKQEYLEAGVGPAAPPVSKSGNDD